MPVFSPSKSAHAELRKKFPLVPVWREVVADLETPVSAYLKVAQASPSFLLESVEQQERWGRYSFIGIDPYLVIRATGDSIETVDGSGSASSKGSPLEAFRKLLEERTVPDLDGLPPFFAGAVGYIGYDMVRFLEDIPGRAVRDIEVPDMEMLFARTMVIFDHLRQRMTLLTLVDEGDTYEHAVERLDDVASRLARPISYAPSELATTDVPTPPSSMEQSAYEGAVERAKEYILSGDIFQVVLSHRFSIELRSDPFEVYRTLRLVNPSPYMFFLRDEGVTVLGSSPEPLVKVDGERILQRPIAGTRPRGASEEKDDALAAELVADAKERAEHIMLVDLARNDVGRVSRYGSVEVEDLMIVERYSHVMHMVSQVTGILDGASSLDALYASFPAGTVTGAPKIRAMQIIDELEPTRRGPYAGVVGYFDLSGNLDTCIALRTAYVVDGVIHVQVGAGIVADSDPAAEWNETVNKAKAMLTAVSLANDRAP